MIYSICGSEKFKREFTAQDQMKRASLSIMNNIAEGFGRFSNKEFIRFLNIAVGSAEEVHSMAILYSELLFIGQNQKDDLISLIKKAKYQTLGLIKYLNTKI